MKSKNVNSTNQTKTKKMSMKSLKFIILVILIAVFVILIPVGYSLFSDTDSAETETRLGEIDVELKENWPNPDDEYTPQPDEQNPNPEPELYDEYGIKKYSKEIYGHSVAELDSYVRVRCIPVVEYKNQHTGEWVTVPVSQDAITVTVSGDDWTKSGDYWYYKNVLIGYEDTEKMNIDWTVNEIPSEIAQYPIRTDVRVILEYAQASNNMWKNIFQIEQLPEGVQQY